MTSKSRMRTIRVIILVVAIGLPLSLAAESMWSTGPPNGYTGAPGENACNLCHEFGPGDGWLYLVGAPVRYSLGQTYDLTVTIQDPGQERWGFELTAIDGNGNGAGTFTITDPDHTQLSDNSPETARDYVKQTLDGTYNGTVNGPVAWKFQWTAPSTDMGEITFYVAADAADGDGTAAGDYSYTATWTSDASDFPVPSLGMTGLLLLAAAILGVSLVFFWRRRVSAGRLRP